MSTMPKLLVRLAIGFAALLAPTLSWAADAAADKSGYTLLNPTPDALLRSFASDRPLNALNPYTVDAGHYFIESDFLLYGQSSDRTTTTRTFQALDPEFRIGLTNHAEFDITTTGLLTDRTVLDRTGQTVSRDTGTGPVTLRLRYNVLGDDGGTYAFAVSPFLVVPTGGSFSNTDVEGGLTLPLAIALPADFSLILETQVQAVHDSQGSVYANFTDVAFLSHAVPGVKNLSAVLEFTSNVNTSRITPDTYTIDTALAYQVADNTQLDLSAFVGLNRAAPDFQISTGIAHRF